MFIFIAVWITVCYTWTSLGLNCITSGGLPLDIVPFGHRLNLGFRNQSIMVIVRLPAFAPTLLLPGG